MHRLTLHISPPILDPQCHLRGLGGRRRGGRRAGTGRVGRVGRVGGIGVGLEGCGALGLVRSILGCVKPS